MGTRAAFHRAEAGVDVVLLERRSPRAARCAAHKPRPSARPKMRLGDPVLDFEEPDRRRLRNR
jgi:hypothetical protein